MNQVIQTNSYVDFWESLPNDEQLLVDYLRNLATRTLPSYCREKITNGVPYFYGKKRICLIWPASVKGGGVRRGVLFGFCYGNKLADPSNYLDHGTNKRIFYKIFQSLEEIDEKQLCSLLKTAINYDEKINPAKTATELLPDSHRD